MLYKLTHITYEATNITIVNNVHYLNLNIRILRDVYSLGLERSWSRRGLETFSGTFRSRLGLEG